MACKAFKAGRKKIVVITSVNLADGGMSTVGYDKENNSFWKIKNDYVPAHYIQEREICSQVSLLEDFSRVTACLSQ